MFAPAQEQKHLHTSQEAATIFAGDVLTVADDCFDYGETRLSGRARIIKHASTRCCVATSAPKRRRRSDRPGFTPYLKTIQGAPDLVVEVLSPATGYYDTTRKRRVYDASGVHEYWIVDPKGQTVEVLKNEARTFERVAQARRHGRVSSRVLDGFAVELERLFA